jgi:hypothetical protein
MTIVGLEGDKILEQLPRLVGEFDKFRMVAIDLLGHHCVATAPAQSNPARVVFKVRSTAGNVKRRSPQIRLCGGFALQMRVAMRSYHR